MIRTTGIPTAIEEDDTDVFDMGEVFEKPTVEKRIKRATEEILKTFDTRIVWSYQRQTIQGVLQDLCEEIKKEFKS